MLEDVWLQTSSVRENLKRNWQSSDPTTPEKDLWSVDGFNWGGVLYRDTFKYALERLAHCRDWLRVLEILKAKFSYVDVFDVMGSGLFLDPRQVDRITGLRRKNIDGVILEQCKNGAVGNIYDSTFTDTLQAKNREVVEIDVLSEYQPISVAANRHRLKFGHLPNMLVCRPMGLFGRYSFCSNDSKKSRKSLVNFYKYLFEDMTHALEPGGLLLSQMPDSVVSNIHSFMIEQMKYECYLDIDGSNNEPFDGWVMSAWKPV